MPLFSSFSEAFWNASEMSVGWMPLFRSFSEASSSEPASTTTDVVPSPASMSWALDKYTSILAAGCMTFIWSRMVAPSLVIVTPPLASWIILSMPLGPRDVLMASARALAARMFDERISAGFLFLLDMSPEGLAGPPEVADAGAMAIG